MPGVISRGAQLLLRKALSLVAPRYPASYAAATSLAHPIGRYLGSNSGRLRA